MPSAGLIGACAPVLVLALLVGLPQGPGWPGAARAQEDTPEASPEGPPGNATEPCAADNHTAADCPNGSCYEAPPNGCGSRSLTVISDRIVPVRWPAGVDFTEACNRHDRCYFTPNSTQAECDDAFHQALLEECGRALRCADLPFVGQQCFDNPSNNPLYGACSGLADLYYESVSSLGGGPFARDQTQAAAHAEECSGRAVGGEEADQRRPGAEGQDISEGHGARD